MHGFWIKGTKEQKYWIKLIQDLEDCLKFLAESLVLTLNYL